MAGQLSTRLLVGFKHTSKEHCVANVLFCSSVSIIMIWQLSLVVRRMHSQEQQATSTALTPLQVQCSPKCSAHRFSFLQVPLLQQYPGQTRLDGVLQTRWLSVAKAVVHLDGLLQLITG